MYLDNTSSVKYGYVPDVCKLLHKYRLQYIMNYYIDNNQLFPSKGEWKKTVNKSIIKSETLLWKSRLNADRDFEYFKYLHTDIKPAIIYQLSNEPSFRFIAKEIANIWSKPASDVNNECPYCKEVNRNQISHIISNCLISKDKKDSFLTKLSSILTNEAVIIEIINMSSSDLTLKLLGAEIGPLLEKDKNTLFLKLAFKYIFECQKYII